eukprot:TRINITY_DN92060_c0_g1_i1.p1 TRINITY_DN92060_c0_g1~~TRINITY_DN92060_c0_g1_i1.p1  ORF type:complete len:581 (-),score=128.21 TRINITY_DN92060_c0_g1_i1:248-1990(-)
MGAPQSALQEGDGNEGSRCCVQRSSFMGYSSVQAPPSEAGGFSRNSSTGLGEEQLQGSASSTAGSSLQRQRSYGGNYSFTGAHYKMKVAKGISPMQWINGFAKKVLVLGDILLDTDGTFKRPQDMVAMFPKSGIDLRWRWDIDKERIIIDFYKEGKLLDWRWDELTPRGEMRFPSTAPDLVGVGHVGKFSFNYQLLSVTAEAAPRQTSSGTPTSSQSRQKLSDASTKSGEDLQSFGSMDGPLLLRLEPVTRDGRNFPAWNSMLQERLQKDGFEGLGSIFSTPPPECTLGVGAYGVVWMARNKETGENYAVKNMSVRRNAAFLGAVAQNEFEMAEKLSARPHPCIVGLLGVESFDMRRGGLYMLVMEFCAGGDLQEALDAAVDVRSRKYSVPKQALSWIAQVFLGMEHIHTQLQLLIRDLKPSNVVLTKDMRAKLTDFGYGRLVAEAPGGQWTFMVPPSTPGYAAPELFSQEPYSYPVDVYSFGVLCWVILSGGDRSRGQPAPPTAGKGMDFSTYMSDADLIKDAIDKPEKARCPLTEEARDAIVAMTRVEQQDRPDWAALRELDFFKLMCLPLAGLGDEA